MKKITNKNTPHSNKRGLTARCASAIVCCALLLLGATAFAQPANNDFANAITVSGTSFTQAGTTVGATRQAGDPDSVKYEGGSPARTTAGDRSVWYRWTAPAGGVYTLTSLATGGTAPGTDTQLGVYTGVHGGLIEVESAEDSLESGNNNALGGGQSRLRFTATGGAVYSFMVNGYESVEVNFNLILSSGGTTNPPPTGLTLTVASAGSGTVTRDVAQPVDGYATNTVVTLTAVPTGTNTFVSWGGDAAASGSTNPITITMDANKVVTATFTTNSTGGSTTFELNVVRSPSNSSGSVTRIPNKSRYTNGEVVTVIARPAGSRTFLGWTGTDQASPDRTNTVTMTSDKTITAAFSGTGPGPEPGAYAAVVGTYNGLFFDSAVSTNCSGSFTVKVSKNGKFTVRMKKGGKNLGGSGQLSTAGTGTATIGKAPRPVTTVDIQLDITGVDPTINGTVTTTDGCASTLEGDRVVFSARNQSPNQGTYTFILPRNAITGTQTNDVVTTNTIVVTNNPGTIDEIVVTNITFTTNSVVTTNDTVLTPGHGYASLVISKSGGVRIRGALADGTKFNQSTTISTNGEIPFFVSLYRGHGLLIGWLSVTDTIVSGDPINWKRPSGGLLFPSGIDADIPVVGSKFDKTRNPFINLGPNAVVELGGNDPTSTGESQVIPVEFSRANTLVEKAPGTSRLLVRLLPSGLIQGKFTSAVTGKNTVLQGAMVQNANAGSGFFINKAGSRGFFEVRNEVIAIE